MTSLEICEYQANTCAAAFLMPRALLEATLHERMNAAHRLDLSSPDTYNLVRELAENFNVSQKAMRYRLLHLNLATE